MNLFVLGKKKFVGDEMFDLQNWELFTIIFPERSFRSKIAIIFREFLTGRYKTMCRFASKKLRKQALL